MSAIFLLFSNYSKIFQNTLGSSFMHIKHMYTCIHTYMPKQQPLQPLTTVGSDVSPLSHPLTLSRPLSLSNCAFLLVAALIWLIALYCQTRAHSHTRLYTCATWRMSALRCFTLHVDDSENLLNPC